MLHARHDPQLPEDRQGQVVVAEEVELVTVVGFGLVGHQFVLEQGVEGGLDDGPFVVGQFFDEHGRDPLVVAHAHFDGRKHLEVFLRHKLQVLVSPPWRQSSCVISGGTAAV